MNPKLYSIIAVFTAIIGGSAIGSSPSGRLLFSINTENIARIGVLNHGGKNTTLSLINNNGEILYTQNVQGGENHFRLLDLSKLPDGKYSIKLSGNSEEMEKKFSVTGGKAVLIKEVAEIPPKFHLINEETFVIFYHNTQNEKVNVTFENKGEIVFSDTNLNGSPVKKTYSLKELPKGEYIVFISAGKMVYSYSLSVK